MRILGIDYGSKRVGLALGDTASRLASPCGVITWDDRLTLISKIHDVCARDLVEAVVVGVPQPLHDQSADSEQTKEVRSFIVELKALGLPIYEESEVLTSQLAARQVRDAGEKGKRDDLAAAAILQTWLDRRGSDSS